MLTQQGSDPFSSLRLLTLPAFDGDISETWQLSAFDRSLKSTTFTLDTSEEEKLPPIRTDLFTLNLDDASLPDLDSTSESAGATDAENDNEQDINVQLNLGEEEEDIWVLPDLARRGSVEDLLSWDCFLHQDHRNERLTYLSETPEGVFGQKIHLCTKKDDLATLKRAKGDLLLLSLRELCLGRESIFFSYEHRQESFVKCLDHYTLPGISADAIDSTIYEVLQIGDSLRALNTWIGKESGVPANRVRKALCAAVSTVILAVESTLHESALDTVSPLQLQEVIWRPSVLLSTLRTLTKSCQQTEEDLGPFVHSCHTLSEKYPWLRELLQEVLARTASSHIEAIGQSIGLGTVPMSTIKPKTALDRDAPYSLLTAEATAVLIESQRDLSLLRASNPSHPLLNNSTTSHTNLKWEYSWRAISKLQVKANEYETRLKQAILGHKAPAVSLLDSPILKPENLVDSERTRPQFQGGLLDIHNAGMETALNNELALHEDSLYQLVTSAVSNSEVRCLSLQSDLDQSMSLSLMPLLTSQNRLLSYSILSLLFETHNLQIHLQTLSRFLLFSDGLFASRLSYALFDSSEASGEARRRNGGRTGLRLQSRDTWPPASSELRLVLMGILSDSISTGVGRGLASRMAASTSQVLLESFSFAIRDLPDEQLEMCRNADTIHALDFLALQYRAATPLLEAVITSRSLKVYDDIFMHLLRLLRLKATAQELVRDVTRRGGRGSLKSQYHLVRLEVRHFVLTIADWAQNVVIGHKWAAFASSIKQVHECLRDKDYGEVLLRGKGLEFVKRLHEDVVDEIARTLFLKRKYVEVRALLDDVFDIVLQLAKHMRLDDDAENGNRNDEMMLRLHESFRKQVKKFLSYLRSHSSDMQDNRDSKGPEALMDQLAIRLDMFEYYSK